MSENELSREAAATPAESNGVLALDLAGSVCYSNQAAESMTARTRYDLVGRPLTSVFETIDGVVPRARAEAARWGHHDGARATTYRAWVLDRCGELCALIEFLAEPIHDRDGRVAGTMVVFRKATDLSPPPAKMPQQTLSAALHRRLHHGPG